MQKSVVVKVVILASLIMSILMTAFMFPQVDFSIDQIIAKLQRYGARFPTEKVYLHVAQPLYASGEKVWYEAYVPNALSTILYVDLINPVGKPIIQQKLKINEGAVHGDFTLPDTLQSGQYLLRGYTLWMRNFDPAYFFKKEIAVVNAGDVEMMTVTKEEEEMGISFYPEGGSLVNGLSSKVAFKATDGYGKNVSVRGEVVDSNGNTIASFRSAHEGLGAFELRPEKGLSYVAKVQFGQDQYIHTYPLPPVMEGGVRMKVKNTSALIFSVEVQATPAFARQHEQAYVVAQAGGKPFYVVEGKLGEGNGFFAEIPKQQLPAGVVHLTLFTKEEQPLCERLVFVAPKNKCDVKIQTNKATYGQREKVEMSIHTTDHEGKGVPVHLSLAVVAQSLSATEADLSNIQSSLLLTADLSGMVENPVYYFDSGHEKAAEHLDLLLLTQAWKKFDWEEILEENYAAPAFEMERGLSMSGAAYSSNGQPLPFKTIQFYFLKQGVGNTATTDATGRFDIPILDYYGDDQLLYEITGMDREDIRIDLDGPFADAQILGVSSSSIDQQAQTYLSQAIDRSRIEDSYTFYDVVPDSVPEGYVTSAYQKKMYHEADYSRDLDKYVDFPNMKEMIKEIVPNVSLREKSSGYQIRLYSEELQQSFDSTPLFLIDGVPTYDTDFVMQMNPENIRLVELLFSRKNISGFGYPGRNGIMALYTREGNFDENQLPANITMAVKGFYDAQTFDSPTYATMAVTEKRRPDFRPLLYWNPEIQTDENGIAHLSFYTSDDIGSYQVHTEGIASTGVPCIGTASFQIVSSQ